MINHTSGAQEVYVFQNSKKTLAVKNGLQLAVWDVYSRIHNPGGKKGKSEKSGGYPSTLKFTAIEKDGANSKIVSFNLSPTDVRLLFFKFERLRNSEFEWTADRLHAYNKSADGRCPMNRMSISRIPNNSKGEPYRSPWFIKIQNGTAIPVEMDTGSIMAKKGSWKEEVTVTVMLSDDDYFRCLSTCVRAIELWEQAYAIPHIRKGDTMVKIKQAIDSAIDADGVLAITPEKAKHTLITIASSIIELDIQTREVVKAYNNLLEYYTKLTEKDFSAFRLQTKKAQKSE